MGFSSAVSLLMLFAVRYVSSDTCSLFSLCLKIILWRPGTFDAAIFSGKAFGIHADRIRQDKIR